MKKIGSLCALYAVLDSQGIVVKCTAAIFFPTVDCNVQMLNAWEGRGWGMLKFRDNRHITANSKRSSEKSQTLNKTNILCERDIEKLKLSYGDNWETGNTTDMNKLC